MDDKDTITGDQIRQLAVRFEADVKEILQVLKKAAPGNGTSPIIITEGSLMITSIGDAITLTSGSVPYTYTTKSLSLHPLCQLKHCKGNKPVLPRSSWKLQIDGTVGTQNNTITIAPSGSAVQIRISASLTGGAPAPSIDDPPGENVLAIPGFTTSSAEFDAGDGTGLQKVGHEHMSLHFSMND